MIGRRLILWLVVIIIGLGTALSSSSRLVIEDPPENVKAIFAKNCVLCHKGEYPPMKLSLEPERIAAAIDAPSQEVPSLKIIDTAAPENSYLLRKVKGTTGAIGKPMPPGKPLTSGEVAILSAWITSLKK